MPTTDDFRRIALSFPGAQEGAHMGHADFRVGGKVFATALAAAWRRRAGKR
jgi:predicted DNA-binding protein (MmcQ/YjbR family)